MTATVTSKVKLYMRNTLLLTKKALLLIKGSKLGIAGLGIIFAFVFMAIFAPWLAPYNPAFIAPAEDIFNIDRIVVNYSASDGYHPIVIGPTTPGESAMEGGTWFILANTNGTIRMDFAIKSQIEDPFTRGNISIVLDIADLGLDTPLSEVLYITPARGYNNSYANAPTYGERVTAGLLAFMANDSFVILDPFTDNVLYQESVGFEPIWFNQDTTSAANMLNPPTQKKITTGWFPSLEGPMRYITLADDSHILTFKFEYCWNDRGIGLVQKMLDQNLTVAEEPLAYTFDNPKYRDNVTGIYVPTANGTLNFYNSTTNGTPQYAVQLNISGAVAEFTGPMGFFRSPDSFPRVYIPTGANGDFSVKVLDPTQFQNSTTKGVIGDFAGTDGEVTLAPTSAVTGNVYATVNYVADDGTPYSAVYRINSNGTVDPNFLGEMESVAVTVFPVESASLIYAMDTQGTVWASQSISSVDTPFTDRGMKEKFNTGSPQAQFVYFGSFGGTKYSTTTTSEEIYVMFYNPDNDAMTIFQATGTSLGALPPGTYPSGNTYYLGTDNVGHDILTLLIYGSRVALYVGLTAAFFSVVVGTLVGLVSGYYGGMIDVILMRITDIALSLPFLPIVLIWGQIWGPSMTNIVIILALFGWPGITRVVRAQTLSLKERSFIDAARVSGSSDTKIIMKHIAPNVLPFTFLYMTLFVAGAILTEAALSYLALGDPKSISWGNMLSTIQTSGSSLIAPWWLLPPGLCITILSMGFYLLGRGVDEIINPRLRRR